MPHRTSEVGRTGTVGLAFIIASSIWGGCSGSTEPAPPDVPTADVEVSVSGPTTVRVGEESVFSVILGNAGPDASRDVTPRAALAGPYELVSVSGNGEQDGDVVTWPVLSSVGNGSSIAYSVVLRPTAVGSITVGASADAATNDPDAMNNDGSASSASVTAQAIVEADLAVQFDMPPTADGGDTIVVTLSTTNAGPSPAAGVIVTYTVPADAAIVSASNGGTADGTAITWPTTASLDADGGLVYEVRLVVPQVGPFETVLEVTAESTDSSPGNNGATQRTLVTATPFRTIEGQIVGEQFGWEVEPVGDVDGDGAADLAVAAPFGNNGGSGSGSIYIHSGADGSLIRRFDGQSGDWLGIDMDAGGDFTGDGVPELIVGAPTADGVASPGRVYVFSVVDGSTIQVITGENAGDRFGWSAAPAGDVNDDGILDLYVGARDSDAAGTNSGRAYVYSGADWSLLFMVDGESAGDLFGQAGGGVGDLDGDGFDDIAIGAPNWGPTSAAGPGRVYVVSGATGADLFPPIDADATGVNLGGFWVFGPGDLNGDAVPDVVASDLANQATGGDTGRVYVFSGLDGSPIHTLTGESAGGQYGIAHPAGDLDGDGFPDLGIAAWLSSEGAGQAGKVYLISGMTGEALRTITSTTGGENFGFDAYVLGDVTGDGVPDIAVSGGISSSTAGHVKLFAGLEP
jgi:uncharacterized repeat protein (TIGR01451 family)